MSRRRKYFRKFKHAVWYLSAGSIITLAVFVSVLRIFLPDITSQRENIEELAGTFLEHSVKIDSMDARLVGFTPTIIFNNIRMLDKYNERELVKFKQARLGIALFESIRQQRVVPSDFTIEGVHLAITRQKNGRFQIQGVDITRLEESISKGNTEESNELADWLFKRTRLAITNSIVVWQDLKRGGKALQFNNVNLELANDDLRHLLNGQLTLQEEMGRSFEVALDVTGDMLNPLDMEGDLYVSGTGVHLDKWGVKPKYLDVVLQQGLADFRLWGEWRAGNLTSLSGDVTAYNVELSLPIMDKPFKVKLLGGLFDVRRSHKGWDLNVDRFRYMSQGDVWPETRFNIAQKYAVGKEKASLQVNTEYFRLEDVSALLLKTSLLDKEQHKILKTLALSGDIRNLHFRQQTVSKDEQEYVLKGRFARVTSKPWRSIPGMNGMQGEVWADSQHGQLALESQYATLNFPKLFRQPINLNSFKGEFNWEKTDSAWQIWADEVIAENEDGATNTRVAFELPDSGKSPYMDLQVLVNNGNAENLERYYPTDVMGKATIAWLDQGIVSGYIKKGGVVFNGRLADFPFKNKKGRFLAELEGENAVINYKKGWPRITNANMFARFSGLGLQLNVPSAKVLNSRIYNARVSLESYRDPLLKLDGKVAGPFRDTAYFLVDSPLFPHARDVVESMRFKGAARTALHINIPLSKKVKKISPLGFSGEVVLKNAQVHLMRNKLDVTELSGKLLFNEKEQTGSNIKGRVLGGETQFNLFTQRTSQGKQINIVAQGELDSNKAMRRFQLPGAGHIHGKTRWQAVLELGKKQGDKRLPPVMRITSKLQGVKIDMPRPVGKPADEIRDYSAEIRFVKKHNIEVDVDYNRQFSWKLHLNTGGKYVRMVRSHLHLAAGQAHLPAEEFMQVSGTLNNFSMRNWLTALRNKKAPQRPPFFSIPVKFDMDRLHLAPFVKVDNNKQQNSDFPPVKLPPLAGRIKQLVYDKLDLGLAEFDVRKVKRGLRLAKVVLSSENLKFTGSGHWLMRRKQHDSSLDYLMEVEDLSRLMKDLGVAAVIDQGETVTRGRLQWPGAPNRFSLASVKGNVHFTIEDGSITKVQPGAGRLLGLLSLSALPRRLMLDFRDTFREGFSFDDIKGDVNIANGHANTSNIQISSPVAEVSIKGRTGLVDKDFDQHVKVIPQVGDTLPLAGGLLFGTQVGAVILFFEKLLGKEIEEATAQEYHITGSWKKPKIERIGQAEEEVVEEEKEEEEGKENPPPFDDEI